MSFSLSLDSSPKETFGNRFLLSSKTVFVKKNILISAIHTKVLSSPVNNGLVSNPFCFFLLSGREPRKMSPFFDHVNKIYKRPYTLSLPLIIFGMFAFLVFLFNQAKASAFWARLPLWNLNISLAVTLLANNHAVFLRLNNLPAHFSLRVDILVFSSFVSEHTSIYPPQRAVHL